MIYVEIRIWDTTTFEQSPGVLSQLSDLLSAEERQRAARFVKTEHQTQFVIHHAIVRQHLAERTGCLAKDLEIVREKRGKPVVLGPNSTEFSLTHSGTIGALAVCSNASVGIDIERMRPLREDLANRFFADPEKEQLALLSDDERERAFFGCWTRKEAFVKATGEGIGRGLDSFVVSASCAPSGNALLQVDGEDTTIETAWSVQDIEVPTGYAGAVAVAAPHSSVVIEIVSKGG